MNQITLTNDPAQSFSIAIDDTVYYFTVKYNTRYGVWVFDIASEDINVDGIALIDGVNLIQQYPSKLDCLFLINLTEDGSPPDAENLAEGFAFVQLYDDELEDIKDGYAI